MYFLLIMFGVIAVFIGIYLYVYLRRMFCFWKQGRMKRWEKRMIAAVAALLALGCVNPFGTPALVIYHILGISAVLEIVNGVIRFLKKYTRRQFQFWNKIFRCGMVPIALTGLIIVCGHFHMLDIKEKTYEVDTGKYLEQPEGYRIAFLSDLHFGTTMNAEKLERYCREISKQDPDIVILGGDIVDERTSGEEMEQAFSLLGNIANRYGIFYVFGNHDRATYSADADYSVEDLTSSIRKNQIHCLADESYEINNDLLLIGREDRGYGGMSFRKDTETLIGGGDKNRFMILADHQPLDLTQNAEAGVDLQLSGHTHGGQIWPVGLLSDLLGFGELNYGRERIGDYTAIVSSGIAGWGYAVRTGHDSEYLIIEVKSSCEK